MVLRRSTLCAVVIALTIAGYPVVAGVSALLGVPNTQLSIGMRGLVLGLSVFLIALGLQALRRPSKVALLLLFLLLVYGLRLMEQILFRPGSLGGSDYLIWFIGVTMAPVLAAMVTPNITGRRVYELAMPLLLIAGLLAVQQGSFTAASGDALFDTGRLALTTLNPISLGYIGVSVVLLSVWAVFGQRRNLTAIAPVHLGVAMFGLYLVYASGSRGPAVALMASLLVMVLSLRGGRKLWFIGGAGILALTVTTALPDLFPAQSQFLQRFDTLLNASTFAQDQSNTERMSLFLTSLEQINAHPLFGSSIENEVHRWSPHNIFLEFALANGIAIAALAVGVMIRLGFLAVAMIRERHDLAGVALLFVASAVSVQFSGNVYQSAMFWVTAMVIAMNNLPARAQAAARMAPQH